MTLARFRAGGEEHEVPFDSAQGRLLTLLGMTGEGYRFLDLAASTADCAKPITSISASRTFSALEIAGGDTQRLARDLARSC